MRLMDVNVIDSAERSDAEGRILEDGRGFGLHGLIEWAVAAEAGHDWDEAARRFGIIRERFPADRIGYIREAAAFREAGRPHDAEMALVEGICRIGDDFEILTAFADLAERQKDWPAAERRLKVLRDKFPGHWSPYVRLSSCLLQTDRLAEAERILQDGVAQVPDELELSIQYASLAERRRDWPEALRRFGAVQARFPARWWFWLRTAAIHREMGQLEAAERMLEEGQTLYPDEVDLFIDHAVVAEHRQDWPEALRRYALVRERFSGRWWFPLRIARVFREMGRLEDAERTLQEGQALYPDEVDLFIDHAGIAEHRRDWPEALRRFEGVRKRFPDRWWFSLRIARVYREMGRLEDAERTLQEGQALYPDEVDLFIDHAGIAEHRRDWPEALRRYELVRGRFPDVWVVLLRLAGLHKELHRFDEAERLLLDAQARFPGQVEFFIEHAVIAEARREWPEALRRFARLKERFEDRWWFAVKIAALYRDMGRFEDAERVLLEAQHRYPGHIELFIEHAVIADSRLDWAEVIRRCAHICGRFPHHFWAYTRRADALRRLGRFAEAEAILEDAQGRFPNEPVAFLEHARLAEAWLTDDIALERFNAVCERFVDRHESHIGKAHYYTKRKRYAEGAAILVDFTSRFPDQPEALIELSFVMAYVKPEERMISLEALGRQVDQLQRTNQGNISLLVARAQITKLEGKHVEYYEQIKHISDIAPTYPLINEKLVGATEILMGMGLMGPDGSTKASAQPVVVDEMTASDLLSRFESLGGGGPNGFTVFGCEFGFVQRLYKIEPLSLLRWIGVALPNLIRAAQAGFKGVGSESSTVITAGTSYDWCMVDTTYHLHCDHTHLEQATVSQAEATAMMRQRMTFLTRKLIEDLEDGEKLFVYRYSAELPGMETVLEFAEAFNAFGNNVVLFVCRADAENPTMSVRRIRPGLIVGYLDRFAVDDGEFRLDGPSWISLCRNAYAEWRGAPAPI